MSGENGLADALTDMVTERMDKREAVLTHALTDMVKERMERRDGVMARALADVVKERMAAILPAAEEARKIDMTPIAVANEKLMYAVQELARTRPQISVAAAPPAQITVNVDTKPLADAIQKQTDCLEKLMGRILTCLEKDKGKEIEIIKDKDGKITGARRK